MAKILDTSALTRFLTYDDPRKATAVKKLLKGSKEELLLPDVLIAELVWLLGSFYKMTRDDIGDRLTGLFAIETLKINRAVIFQTLEIYKNINISWIDAYACALVQSGEADGIYSYDKGISRVSGIKRLEP